MDERRSTYRIWWGYLRQSYHLEHLGTDGKTYFNISSIKIMGRRWIELAQVMAKWHLF
jgi:hypothetical protein